MLGRESRTVSFSYQQDLHKGSLTGPTELMAAAFKRGAGTLVKPDDQRLGLAFIAYSAGSDTVYFETAKKQAEGVGWVSHHTPASPKRAPPGV